MITFTGIVFSAVFVAAQIQTSSYSPRLATRLRRDRIVIAGLALPTATASYSLFALAAIGRQTDRLGRDAVPAITVLVALVLAVVTFGAFVALVQRAFDSTQIGGILRGLLREAHRVIEEVHPSLGRARVCRRRRRPRTGSSRYGTSARPPCSPRSTAGRCCASPGRRARSSRWCRCQATTSRRGPRS